jgi:hypothetical protein
VPIDRIWGEVKVAYTLLYRVTFGKFKRWCPGAESNHRHEDFQSTALPTELPGRYFKVAY